MFRIKKMEMMENCKRRRKMNGKKPLRKIEPKKEKNLPSNVKDKRNL
jgi:hypothetical protein